VRDYNAEFNTGLSVPERPAILADWTARGRDTRMGLGGELDVPYGRSAGETLDFFPAATKDAPLLVFIHGGWFRSLDKNDFAWMAPAYLKQGINVAMPNYALAPVASVRQITQQMLRAISFLYVNAPRFGFDTRRIVVAGHSAGGHLAAMMMAARWADYLVRPKQTLPEQFFKGGVLISGVFDMRPVVAAPFINDDLKLTTQSALEVSPAFMPPASDALLVTAVGGKESLAFIEQTRLINARWQHVLQQEVAMPEHNHFTVCDAFADPAHPLFAATMGLLQ
jgi:arylformamidase